MKSPRAPFLFAIYSSYLVLNQKNVLALKIEDISNESLKEMVRDIDWQADNDEIVNKIATYFQLENIKFLEKTESTTK